MDGGAQVPVLARLERLFGHGALCVWCALVAAHERCELECRRRAERQWQRKRQQRELGWGRAARPAGDARARDAAATAGPGRRRAARVRLQRAAARPFRARRLAFRASRRILQLVAFYASSSQ